MIQASVHTSSVRSLRYGWWAYALGERTTPRLKQYSKIISVDGNLASGKGALAQKLADKLGNYLITGILSHHSDTQLQTEWAHGAWSSCCRLVHRDAVHA